MEVADQAEVEGEEDEEEEKEEEEKEEEIKQDEKAEENEQCGSGGGTGGEKWRKQRTTTTRLLSGLPFYDGKDGEDANNMGIEKDLKGFKKKQFERIKKTLTVF